MDNVLTTILPVIFCSLLPRLLLAGYPAILGIRALGYSKHERGEQAFTLRMLAIHMLEPLVSALLAAVFTSFLSLLSHATPDQAMGPDLDLRNILSVVLNLGMSLVLLAPILMLLLPARGLRFSDPDCQRICRQLTYLGGARLLFNALVWLPGSFLGAIGLIVSNIFVILNVPVNLILYGILLKKFTSLIRNQTYPRSPQPLPVVQPATAPPAPARPPLTPATTVFCPVCREPTGLHDEDCPGCGLLFTSRVPPALRGLSGYTVLRPLGQGGMGSVYLGQARHSAQLCVIKTLASVDEAADPAWQADAARCLAREAELLAQIVHPHIPRLIEAESQGAFSYMVTEYIPGPTVEQRLSHITPQGAALPGQPIPPAEALPLIARIAATLTELSDLPRPLMHLDIKPANLILAPDRPAPMLVDFGSAAWIADIGTSMTRTLGSFGTPGYAAPEQYSGQASSLSDCYGLAATLYHMLSDDDPGEHPLAFPALATLPEDIVALLTPALDRDPARRPTMRALSAGLETLAACYTAGKPTA